MSPSEYQILAARTESTLPPYLVSDAIWRIQHGAIGIATEAGELLDALKKHLYYQRGLDIVNVREELGDVLWYVALVCNAIGVDMGQVMEANIDKLRQRYPEKFTPQLALNRDLDAERKALEGET